jgi:hypothetical protein
MIWLWVLSIVGPLAAVGALLLREIDPADWKGAPGPHGPLRVRRNKEKVISVAAGVPAPGALAFELRRENWFDRLSKRKGLAIEGQAGHRTFDDTYFLLGDDPELVDRLRRDRTLCNRLLELSGPRVPPGFRFARIVCAGDTLWAEYGWTRPFADAEVDRLVGGLQLRLQGIAGDLPTAPPGAPTPTELRRRAAMRLDALVLVLFLVAIGGCITVWFTGLPQIVDRGLLWAYSVYFTALLLGCVFDWGRRHVGRSSRTHRQFALWALMGAPSLLVCTMLAVRGLDIWADPHRGYLRMGGITDLDTYSSRKMPTRYAAEMVLLPPDHQPNGRVDKLRLQLDGEDYGRLSIIGGVQVVERPGLLGLRWIERVDGGDEWRQKFGVKPASGQ